MNTTAEHQRRQVRSFVRREGRITHGQKQALEQLWPVWGLEFSDQSLDMASLFPEPKQKIVLEIGFGNGASLAEMAANLPETGFIGIEVYKSGVGQILQRIDEQSLENLKVICADAVEVLQSMIPDDSLDRVQLFFPDPWPKKKHHKRRILKPSFLDLCHSRLKPKGCFHMATDWENYAEEALELLNSRNDFENQSFDGSYIERPGFRPRTKFEQRGQRLGHGVWDMLFCSS